MAAPKKLKATVIRITYHSDTVIEYLFEPNGRVPRFRSGQFLHLALDPYDPSYAWPESRVFSIASSPKNEIIRIVVSVKGRFTERMSKELKQGSEVWLKMPYGDFAFSKGNDSLVLIAGGTGIAPFIPYLEECLEKKSTDDISLYYGIRSPRVLIFDDIISRCCGHLSGLNYTLYCEKEGCLDSGGIKGRIDIQNIMKENGVHKDYYLSGPWEMIKAFKDCLLKWKVPPDQILIDEW